MQTFVSALLSGLQTGSIYALIGVAYVIVYRSTGFLLLSIGEMVMVGGLLATTITITTGGSLLLALVLGAAIPAVLSALIYLGPIRLTRDPSPLRIIILTFGIAMVIRAVARIIWGPAERFSGQFPGLPNNITVIFDRSVIRGQAIVLFVVLFLTVAAVVWWFRSRSTGRAARAIGDDAMIAAAVGIPVVAVTALAFAFSGAVAGVAGIIAIPLTGMAWNAGTMLGLKGLVAALAGGIDNPYGPVIGGLLLGLAEQFASVYVVAGWNDAVAFGVLVAVVLLRSRGPLEART